MKIDDLTSNEGLFRELGERIQRTRIAYPLTQDQLAARAGVSKRTIANIEHGGDVTVGSLASVLRALGLLSRFDLLVPQEEVRPSDLAAGRSSRKRVRTPKGGSIAASWKWGDEL